MSSMDLTNIKGVSEKRKLLLHKIDIYTIADLVSVIPRQYEDLSHILSIAEAVLESNKVLVQVQVTNIKRFYTKKRMLITEVTIQDDSASASLFLFGKQSQFVSLKTNENYLISGLFRLKGLKKECSQFSVEQHLKKDVSPDSSFSPEKTTEAEKKIHHSRIVPVYKMTEGLTQKLLRVWIFQALQILKPHLKENLPSFIIDKHNLFNRYLAIEQIHFPTSFECLKRAQYRLKYFELFKVQFQFALKKHYFQTEKSHSYKKTHPSVDLLLSQLPFDLTLDQKKAVQDIQNDLYSVKSMHRLLMGDVGCGKTLIAFIAILMAIDSGFQAVLLVPTEVLAKQHFQTLSKLVNTYHTHIDILLGSTKPSEKKNIHSQLKNGQCQILIGTHAVFTEKIEYKQLGLIIIDEQHKFGVQQRKNLINKGSNPDILAMSATPIPRTLSYSLFGDMDVSIIKEKPAQRLLIETSWTQEPSISKVFNLLKKQLEKGHQGYIVYPLVEENEQNKSLKSVSQAFKELQNIFPNYKIGLIHGKLSSDEKNYIMRLFEDGKIHILLSTTVIEVGVDVSNTTFIMINNANYFGLSTLHQLRGRVGRNNFQSYCFLVTAPKKQLSEDALEKMKIMVECHDGFVLAEKDLQMRGSGNLLSTEQKGKEGFKIASLVHDADILEKSRKDAFQIIQDDPHCKSIQHKTLQKWVQLFEKEHFSIMQN